ncbi:hypothetical protein Lal_00027695 [Lupinus albus]|uniref:Putative phosphatidate phosphatase n=1 Tax=Lupinus albus TaxID=3870 RepID=A0A6A4QGF2_LUPAL|nr:putative phosphatidate phosphatase [Lupinus albus]KAF1873657.1 hypothetical protein Lal_00027695 [Lupinus albus]
MATITNPSPSLIPTNLHKQKRHFKISSFPHTFSASKSNLCGGFIPKTATLGRNRFWVSNAMSDSALSNNKSNENIQLFEQEAFIDDSTQFCAKFLSPQLESTLNRLSKWIVTVLIGCFILWRHDAEALWFGAGSILNGLLSVWLKRILNQERPTTLKSDPGMPSSHAQSIFFAAFFVILLSVEWLGLNVFTIFVSGLVLASAAFFSYLRVSQKLHTMSQVVVGAAIGSIFSTLWYWLWNAFLLDAFISSIWVRIVVVLGSAGLCLSFFLFAISHWLQNE